MEREGVREREKRGRKPKSKENIEGSERRKREKIRKKVVSRTKRLVMKFWQRRNNGGLIGLKASESPERVQNSVSS